MIFIFLLFYLIFFIVRALPLRFPKYHISPSRLSIFYGGPGSGKTTLAAYFCRKALLSGIPVYSNVPLLGAYEIKKEDIGQFSITDGLLIIDEAGITYNNRDFKKNFSGASQNAALEWWKKHRHEGVECMVFSQGFDDMDKKIQTLGSHYYIVRRSLIPNMIVYKRISKRPKIDENSHQPVDFYEMVKFSSRRVFMRPLWRFFDSFDRMGLPLKDFPIYGKTSLSAKSESVSGSDSGADETLIRLDS